MEKITDRVILGIVSGILAGTPDTIINSLEFRAGMTDVKYGQMGAGLFLKEKAVDSSKGKIVGQLANYTMISTMGVIITYVLSATGRDKAVAKGAGVGALTWVAINGIGAKMGLTNQSEKPLAPILGFFDHLLYGSLCGLIAANMGHSSLFPDGIERGDALPLAGAGDASRINDIESRGEMAGNQMLHS